MAHDIDSIEKRAAAATKGPWVQGIVNGRCHLKHEHRLGWCEYDYNITADDEYERRQIVIAPNVTLIGTDERGPILNEANAAFIAQARQDVPALCAEVRQLRAALKEALEGWADDPAIRIDPDCAEVLRIAELRKLVGGVSVLRFTWA